MFEYLKTIDNNLQAIIWYSIILIAFGFSSALIYKIFKAEKIKAGPIIITDDEDRTHEKKENKPIKKSKGATTRRK